jgi:hypothetical protein
MLSIATAAAFRRAESAKASEAYLELQRNIKVAPSGFEDRSRYMDASRLHVNVQGGTATPLPCRSRSDDAPIEAAVTPHGVARLNSLTACSLDLHLVVTNERSH